MPETFVYFLQHGWTSWWWGKDTVHSHIMTGTLGHFGGRGDGGGAADGRWEAQSGQPWEWRGGLAQYERGRIETDAPVATGQRGHEVVGPGVGRSTTLRMNCDYSRLLCAIGGNLSSGAGRVKTSP